MNNQEKITFISNWISNYVQNMTIPAQSLVVGISGGIDSSLTSALSCKSNINTIAISMPININSHTSNLSAIHGEWLTHNYKNVNHIDIDLTLPYEAFYTSLIDNDQKSDLGFANSKARLRMMTLYQVAAAHKGIVVGTGNKVEDFGVGFYTKYGDGGVDISPIADLMKSEVKSLSETLNIDKRIIEADPTDGLWEDGRTDEKQLGLSYDQLEEAMNNTSSHNRLKYENIRNANLHKMLPIPVCKIPRG
tara:strand:- start:176 stop:922 length:747 start_codon:yes stop_codon:yes gene_type:complete